MFRVSSDTFIHAISPRRTESLPGPDDETARTSDDPQARKEPSISNDAYQGSSHGTSDGQEGIADEVFDRYPGLGGSRHELGKHGGGRGEDKHRANAEEEIGHHLLAALVSEAPLAGLLKPYRCEPEDTSLNCPAVTDQSCWIQDGGHPRILSHTIFRSKDQLSSLIISSGGSSLACMIWSVQRPPSKEARMYPTEPGM